MTTENFRSGANPGIFATGWSSSQEYDASGWKRTCGGERGLPRSLLFHFLSSFESLYLIPTILEQSGSTDLSVSFSYKSGSNKRATVLNQLLIPLVQTGWENCTVRGNNKTFSNIFFRVKYKSDDLKQWHLTDENWPTNNNNIEADTFNNLSNPTSVTPNLLKTLALIQKFYTVSWNWFHSCRWFPGDGGGLLWNLL